MPSRLKMLYTMIVLVSLMMLASSYFVAFILTCNPVLSTLFSISMTGLINTIGYYYTR